MTVSPDGTRLYVSELTAKQIAVADTGSLTVTRVAPFTDHQPGGTTLYLGSTHHLRRIDATIGKVLGTLPATDLRTLYATHHR